MTDATSTPLACPCCAYPLPEAAGATHRCSECGAVIDVEALRAVLLRGHSVRFHRAITCVVLTPISFVVMFGLLIPVARTSEFIQQWFVPIMLTLDAAIVVIPLIIAVRRGRRDGLAHLVALVIGVLGLLALLSGIGVLIAAALRHTQHVVELIIVFGGSAVTVAVLVRWLMRQCLRWERRETATESDDPQGPAR